MLPQAPPILRVCRYFLIHASHFIICLAESLNFFFFGHGCLACIILVPQLGIKPMSTVVEVRSPNHCQMVVFDSFVWLCHCFLGRIYETPHLVISEVLLIGQLIIDRDANIVQWKTDSIFIKWCWHNWKIVCKKVNLSSYLVLYMKIY